MRGKLALVALALSILGFFLAATWMLCKWPPPRFVLRHGPTPGCEPTGRTRIVEGVTFVEIGPGEFQLDPVSSGTPGSLTKNRAATRVQCPGVGGTPGRRSSIDTSAPAIEVRGLTKVFAGPPVLDGIDLTVARGQIFGYIGPNGAGKTTTVKILIGLLPFERGDVRVTGIPVAKDPMQVRRRIGYVPENAALYETLTPMEHLLLVGRLHDLDDDLVEARGAAMLDAFDLRTRANRRIGSLSKGMRQKLMMTAALLHDPEILFLDEPLAGLDVYSTVLVKELLGALAHRGKTVFYCSHLMDVVERICDRIAVLGKGRVVAEGTFDELAAASREGGTLERVFLDLTGGGDAKESADAVLAALDGGARG